MENLIFTKTETKMYVSLANKILWLLHNNYESNVNAKQYFKGVKFAFDSYSDILKDKYHMKHNYSGFLNMVGASRKQYNLEVK